MTNQNYKELRNKILVDYLDNAKKDSVGGFGYVPAYKEAAQAINALLLDIAMEAVGEDWPEHCKLENCDQCRNREQRNYQNYEIRTRIKQLVEGEK